MKTQIGSAILTDMPKVLIAITVGDQTINLEPKAARTYARKLEAMCQVALALEAFTAMSVRNDMPVDDYMTVREELLKHMGEVAN